MGTDKLSLTRDGQTLLERVCAALLVWADEVVVAGPPRTDEGSRDGVLDDHRVRFRQEDPPFGGPVAGLAAALAALPSPGDTDGSGIDDRSTPTEQTEVLVLAGDLMAPEQIVARLVAADLGADGVALVDPQGWPQYLAGRYRLGALRAAIANAPQTRDISVNRVVRVLDLHLVPADTEVVGDVDTPEQARAAGLDIPGT